MITPISIKVHPMIELKSKICPKIINAAIDAKTLSIDSKIAVLEGGEYFCAIVCKVKPKPIERIPVYNNSNAPPLIFKIEGFSIKIAKNKPTKPANNICNDAVITGSNFISDDLEIKMICIDQKNAPMIDKKSPTLPNCKSLLVRNQTPKIHKAADKKISLDKGFL